MTLIQTIAVSALVSAACAYVVARYTLRRWMTHAGGETAQNAAQAALRCSMCGTPVRSVDAGLDHVEDVHGMRLGPEDAETVLTDG